ncbi:bifunctional phosphoribosylaminoimidazolecarboxamide formyltransferase/IMP cyclohydrolase [Oceanispirochaeta sp.]|jgi:phosphoribosylaminoimidazolecarboxamide formyltransferase/IMP cyclohydrolase|uniref:bifunctional phosphoribosylaminoimidazolecarboxamide formyltransferase/IMP cyclohydrolase n=1 Tax=Oceanispirochaeta sp. TaxID=2035350 RepID=UPI002610C026|nr:bifunctional phosphoribosylaminoimidazolecarboxamide formyltransferase/IMP cyclohydrolase [Oceanispirochaeta sp.]MDA3958115.1 bifunctional phosphoribosylaminoimidazolecarboxamide formyltransferase/IMP cyclohydrolase [Oceanispirochaeta sp.]
MKRALISVFNKDGILELGQFLKLKGWEIISTGGTFKYLQEQGLNPLEVAAVTGGREMLDGRVKTLHPVIHGGILAIRDNEEHMSTLKEEGIETIDMVVVNLYPFFDEVDTDKSIEEKVEFIDIGGPTMLRSASKNFQDVTVICNPEDYKSVMEEMENRGDVSFETRKILAGKVFNLTSAYDGAISQFFLGRDAMPAFLNGSYSKNMDLRYGENPHQKAAFYTNTWGGGAFADFKQLGGKELSFNNIRDMDVAWKIVNEFDSMVCCGLKHSTPCGVALGKDAADAYKRAYDCDPISIFGGIVAINGEVSEDAAIEMVKTFLEIVVAPSFSAKAMEVLKKKKNLRIIQTSAQPSDPLDVVKVDGGILVQDADLSFSQDFKVVTDAAPEEAFKEDLIFGQKVVKHVKSNAIVVVKDGKATGIGTGQTNRIWAAQQAIERAGEGTILASDAFFPFDDVVVLCAEKGIRAIIQPGGSIRDADSIKACNEKGIPMIFTGMRHFKH